MSVHVHMDSKDNDIDANGFAFCMVTFFVTIFSLYILEAIISCTSFF